MNPYPSLMSKARDTSQFKTNKDEVEQQVVINLI
jgi:hypothetical protein